MAEDVDISKFLQALSGRVPTVIKRIGYNANYAAAVHERLDQNHKYPEAVNANAQAKFLEQPLKESAKLGEETIVKFVKMEIAAPQGRSADQIILAGLIKGMNHYGELVLARSKKLCPVSPTNPNHPLYIGTSGSLRDSGTTAPAEIVG